eukprot:scaffold23403_cov132-Isochrysis_galbana.AAC.3
MPTSPIRRLKPAAALGRQEEPVFALTVGGVRPNVATRALFGVWRCPSKPERRSEVDVQTRAPVRCRCLDPRTGPKPMSRPERRSEAGDVASKHERLEPEERDHDHVAGRELLG